MKKFNKIETDNNIYDSAGNIIDVATHHAMKCSCGFIGKEQHWYKGGVNTCMYCGYVKSEGLQI